MLTGKNKILYSHLGLNNNNWFYKDMKIKDILMNKIFSSALILMSGLSFISKKLPLKTMIFLQEKSLILAMTFMMNLQDLMMIWIIRVF